MNKTAARQVYEIVAAIPPGKVMTYGDIALQTGIHPRQVGFILHHNPDPAHIPCHRVVNHKGQLAATFAFGGLAGHQAKLISEGVVVVDNQVDLRQYRASRLLDAQMVG